MPEIPSNKLTERVVKAISEAVDAAQEALEAAGMSPKAISLIAYVEIDDFEGVMSDFPTEELLLSYDDPLKVITSMLQHLQLMQNRLLALGASLVNVDGRMN